jgi:hypothetical protein
VGIALASVTRRQGANPATSSYNASVANIYNATSSLVRFKYKIFSSILKNALAYYNTGVVCSYKLKKS